MDTKGLAQLVRDISPALAGSLLGPFGAIATTLISSVFGGASAQDVVTNMKSDPQALVKIEQIKDHLIEIETIVNEKHYAAGLNDLANARAMQIANRSAMPEILAFSILISYLVTFAICLFVREDANDLDITKQVIGLLGMGLGMVLQYYFGSSHEERNKEDAK